jgi:AcrR family transcriptional regulator
MSKGAETKERILDRAFRMAGRDGLDGLSLGRLAEELGMSKSGLFAHFQSKEDLQVEILKSAAARFEQRVVRPALAAPRGLPKLKKLFESWLRWVNDPSLPGGCIFIAAAAELDDKAGQPRELLAVLQKQFRDLIARLAWQAIEAGHFRSDLDHEQFAFELYGIVLSYNHFKRLLHEPRIEARAQVAFDERIAFARAKS